MLRELWRAFALAFLLSCRHGGAEETDTDIDTGTETETETNTETETGTESESETDTDTETVDQVDDDGDGFSEAAGDCDDGDPGIRPGVPEVCDGVDQDCDGVTDDGVTTAYYADGDGDGYGGPDSVGAACAPPAGFIADGTDCDDGDETIYPGAPEACGGDVDMNCDGSLPNADADGDSWPSCAECDDGDAAVHPDADEVCDGADNDCDGTADEGVMNTFYGDADGDGYGDPAVVTAGCTAPAGYAASADDCDDADPGVNPGADEVCDDLDADEDCDGLADAADTDVGNKSVWCADQDGDGYVANRDFSGCAAPATGTWIEVFDLDGDGDRGCDEHDLDGDGIPEIIDDDDADAAVH